jgi:polycomb protein EED
VKRGKDAVTIVKEFWMADAHIWYLRMSVDTKLELLSVGNGAGKCYVWNIDKDPSCNNMKRFATLQLPQCRHPVRQTAFSPDGHTLLYVCDNSTIWRWDMVER